MQLENYHLSQEQQHCYLNLIGWNSGTFSAMRLNKRESMLIKVNISWNRSCEMDEIKKREEKISWDAI